jgi:quinol monooxygenase YgiN
MSEPTEPIEILYFYRTKWGAHEEFMRLFRKNHWPILREGLANGRYTDVHLATPRFHGDGRADWDIVVSITYRDWAAIEAHTEAEIARRLFPDQDAFQAEERRRFELLDAPWDVPLERRPLE